MPRKRPVRVGIVGCGIIAQRQHIPSLLRTKEAEIVAICDKDKALLNSIGSRLKTNKCFSDFSQMLSQEELDLVDICTPPHTHPELAIEAAESGCHVLVEKPAALTLEEFDRIAAACTRNGVKLCQIQNKMFEPVVMGLMQQVESGDIGEVVGVDIKVLSRRAAELAKNADHWYNDLPAGVFTEILPHPIYLAQAFLGTVDPVGVCVKKANRNQHATSDTIKVILEGKMGIGIISYSGPATKDKTIIDINGTRKNLRVDLWNSAKVEYGMGGISRASRAWENLGQCLSLLQCSAGTTISVLTGRFHSGHFTIIKRFAESIRDGTDQPVSIEQAREVIRVLESITEMAAPDKATREV